MSYIDSSSVMRSPLADLGDSDGPARAEDYAASQDEEANDDLPAMNMEELREGQTPLEFLVSNLDDINIARKLPQDVLDRIGMECVREFDLDENSRSEWRDKAERAMKFAVQESEPKQYPWPGASSTIFPLIAQAALQFGSVAYPAIIQNRNVVRGIVWGDDKGTPIMEDDQPKVGPDGQPVWLVAPGEKQKRADRIGEHMSYQLLEEMPEWEPQTDQLLHQIPVIGGAARKSYYDPVQGRNCSLFVSLMNLVWNYGAPSFEAAPRHSEKLILYPHEIIEYERAGADTEDDEGMFLHLDYGPSSGGEGLRYNFKEQGQADGSDEDGPHFFIEQHRRYDLDGDGYPEPYIVTVHHRSSKTVRIVARYDEDGIEASEDGEIIRRIIPTEHYTLIPFLPNIEGGSYPMGFGHLLRPLNDAINTTLNQMFDAGHLQNAGGGFVSDQLSLHSGAVEFRVGTYKRVNTKGMSIREAVFPLPFQGPSPVLFQLLGVLMGAGKDLASIQNVLTGDAAIANAPPTTVLALIEQGMKAYTAIHKRIYRALGEEFKKLYNLNRKYLTEKTRYRKGDEWIEIEPDDYRLSGGVEPIADPTMLTNMQKLVRAQILMGFKDDPQINQLEIKRRLFEAADIDRIDDLFVPPDPQAAQIAQITTKLALDAKQADIAYVGAQQLERQTLALLHMAQAKAQAGELEQAFYDKQMEAAKLSIDAINTNLRAAQIQADREMHTERLGHEKEMKGLPVE